MSYEIGNYIHFIDHSSRRVKTGLIVGMETRTELIQHTCVTTILRYHIFDCNKEYYIQEDQILALPFSVWDVDSKGSITEYVIDEIRGNSYSCSFYYHGKNMSGNLFFNKTDAEEEAAKIIYYRSSPKETTRDVRTSV